MFLGKLEDEKVKGVVVDLAIGICIENANAEFEESEKGYVSAFCKEMGLQERFNPETSIEDAIQYLAAHCSVSEKKGICVEMLALVNIDGNFDEIEKGIIQKLANAFGISEAMMEELNRAVLAELKASAELVKLVGGGGE